MNVISDLLKTCIPTIIGALIVIIPTAINKRMDIKQKREEQRFQDKQKRYIRLISLLVKVLRAEKNKQSNTEDIDELISLINTINITENLEVVKALNDYVNTWGKKDDHVQNNAYRLLVKSIRKDLSIDDEKDKFPDIGLIEINVKR